MFKQPEPAVLIGLAGSALVALGTVMQTGTVTWAGAMKALVPILTGLFTRSLVSPRARKGERRQRKVATTIE